MNSERDKSWSRRKFLSARTLAGTAEFLGLRHESIAAEPPLETDKIRVIEPPEICAGTTLIVAQDLLKSEGFTQLQALKMATGIDGVNAVARGAADFTI